MRTTITLDPDVAERIKKHMRDSQTGFKEAINDLLRKGLAFSAPSARPVFQVKARALGLKPGLSLHSVEDLLDQVEGGQRT